MENALSPADVAVLTGRNNDNGAFGDNGSWFIILFLIFAIFGWGRNGFGSNGSGSGAMDNYVLNSDFATLQRQLSDGFSDLKQTGSRLGDGICNLGYTQAQLINGVNTSVLNAQYNLSNAITTSGYETQTAISGVSSQLANCCCNLKSELATMNYNNAINNQALQNTMCTNTRDIIENSNNNTRSILDFLVKDKIDTLTSENQNLRLRASQADQNAYLINALNPTPIPAYQVANPNCCYNSCGSVGCGY